MREWEVQEGRHVRGFSESGLRMALRSASLSGAEMCRQGRTAPWERLYGTQPFAEELGGQGNIRHLLLRRTGLRLALHVVAYVVIVALVQALPLALGWLLVLAGHAAVDGPLILAASHAPTSLSLPGAQGTRTLVAAVTALLREVEGVAGDEGLADALRGLGVDAESLGSRVTALEAVVDEEGLASLRAELRRLEESIDTSRDARNRQVLTRECASLAARVDGAAGAASELEHHRAEERALGHQVAGLKIELARRTSRAGGEVDLLARIAELRARATAEAEVNAALDTSR